MLFTLINVAVLKSLMVMKVKVDNTDTLSQIFSHTISNAGVVICLNPNNQIQMAITEKSVSLINVVLTLKVSKVVLGMMKNTAGEAADVPDSILIGSLNMDAQQEIVHTILMISEMESVMILVIQRLHGVLSLKFISNVLLLLLQPSQRLLKVPLL